MSMFYLQRRVQQSQWVPSRPFFSKNHVQTIEGNMLFYISGKENLCSKIISICVIFRCKFIDASIFLVQKKSIGKTSTDICTCHYSFIKSLLSTQNFPEYPGSLQPRYYAYCPPMKITSQNSGARISNQKFKFSCVKSRNPKITEWPVLGGFHAKRLVKTTPVSELRNITPS